MLELIFTLVSVVTSFATGVAMFATHVGIPYLSADAAYYVTLLVAYGTIVALIYGVSSVLDAVTPQTSWALYRLSFIASWFAAISLTLASAIVLYQMMAGGHLRQLADIPGSLQLLFGSTLFSWFDVGYLQRRKLAQLRAHGAPTPPPTLVPNPAQTDNWGWVLVAILLVFGLGAAAMFATGVKVPEGLLAFRDKAVVTTPPATTPAPAAVVKEPPVPKAEVPPPAKKPSGKGRVLQSLQEWARLTDECLAENEALSTSHAVPGCFAAEEGDVACTHDRFEEVADLCRTTANAAGRPKGVFH